MKLNDSVSYVTVNDGRIQAEDFQTLECSVSIELSDACDDTQARTLIAGSGMGVYTARPFEVRAALELSTRCTPDRFDEFIRLAVEASTDFAVARALTVAPPAGGYSANGVWIGASGSTSVPFVGDAIGTDPIGFANAVARARTLWHTKVVGREPVLHISPNALPGMTRSGLLARDGAEPMTCWGDPLVTHVGYDPLPAATDRSPVAFWAPLGFEVQRGAAESIGYEAFAAKVNTQKFLVTMPVKIAVAPCAIVRVATTAA